MPAVASGTQLGNLIKITRFAKRAVTKVSDVLSWSFMSPAIGARMWFDWRLRHNAFRQPGLRTFQLHSHSLAASQWAGIQRSHYSACSMLLRMFLEQRLKF